MFSINDDVVRRLAVLAVVDMVETGQYQPLLDMGVRASDLDQLRMMRTADMSILTGAIGPAICITLDAEALTGGLQRVSRMMEDQKMFEYFVQHGASIPMLRSVFKMDRATIDATRLALNREKRAGRPAQLIGDDRAKLIRIWSSTQQESLRARYYAVHLVFGAKYSFESLYACINDSK